MTEKPAATDVNPAGVPRSPEAAAPPLPFAAQHESLYLAVKEGTTDGYWVTDAEGRFLDVNEVYARRSGYSREELLRMYIRDVEAVEDPGAVLEHGRRIRAQGSDLFETAHRSKSGEVWPIEVSCVYHRDSGGIFFSFGRDITDRRQAMRSLEKVQFMLSEAQEIAHVGSFEVDVATGATAWSSEKYRIHGYDPAGPSPSAEETIDRIVSPEDVDAVTEAYARLLTSGRDCDVEYRILRPDGSVRWVHTRGRPYADAEGKRVRVIGTTHDVTERKEIEAKRIEAQAAAQSIRAKTRFLAAASHDLRQPLQAITLHAGALASSGLNAAQETILQHMTQAVKNLDGILDQLLDITKLQSGVLRASPEALIPETILGGVSEEFSALAESRGLRLNLFLSRHCPGIEADPRLLGAILRNLVGNAIKYTDRGGILLGIRRQAERALIQVFDTGIGIAAADLPHIFEEYFQAGNVNHNRGSGRGLGLSIAALMAASMQTTIHCHSVPGRGSVFGFSLPLARGERRGA